MDVLRPYSGGSYQTRRHANARIVAIGALLIVTIASPAGAQVSDRWDVTLYGGLLSPRVPTASAVTLPGAGAPITTSSPVFPGRQAASWFFGDGAAQLNDANGQLGVASRITPLDHGLASLRLDAATRPALGVRVARVLTPRLSAEFALDVLPGSTALGAGGRAAVEATRASFESAFAGLLASGPFTNTSVRAIGSIADGAVREMAATGSLVVRFASARSWTPYAIVGGGVLLRSGTLPSVTLEGKYHFSIAGSVPIDETDRVTLRYRQDSTPAAVVGAGWRQDLSDHWGVRIDGRLFLARSASHVFLDASPSVARADPAGFIESLTYPNLQFSNNSSTGRVSTLGGPAIQGFDVFAGESLQTRFLLTIGLSRRF